MLKNYLIIAWRNLWKNKTFSLINIAGLTIGISVSLMMLLHVKQELSYEAGFPKHKQIYRVASTQWAKISPLIAEFLPDEMPEIKKIGRFYDIKPQILSYKDVQIATQNNYAADQAVIDMFDFQFVFGNPTKALEVPGSIVLTQQIAAKLFGTDTDPVGKIIQLDGNREFTVTGVMKDLPINSHINIECLTAISGDRSITTNDSRIWRAVSTYALIASDQEAQKVNEELKDFQLKFLAGVMTPEEITAQGDFYELDPIEKIHLHSRKEKEMTVNGNIVYVYIFSALALLIIIMACVNFINLFTAQALKRVKEVEVRKVVGASRIQLAGQFFGEAFLTVGLSSILAFTLVCLALPYYNQLATLDLSIHELISFGNLFVLIGIVLTTGLLSGGYPAFYIARYRTTYYLKDRTSQWNIMGVRRGLVAFQLFISVLMLTATLVIFQQMKYVNEKDLGFDKDGIVAIKLYGGLRVEAVRNTDALRNELTQNPNIKHMAITSKMIGERFGYEALKLKGRPDEETIQSRFVRTDEGFIETMGIQLLRGRNFTATADTSSQFIINEKAAQLLQRDNLIGQEAVNMANGYSGKIVGVVKNFNYASLHQEIEPLVIEYRGDWADYLLVNIGSDNVTETMSSLEASIQKLAPGTLFLAHFLNDNLRLMYQTENGFHGIFKIFSLLSIAIAGLGLFALAAYTVEARTKEIGIRKILGASMQQILNILSVDFVKSVLVAGALAVPLAHIGSSRWLENFAYRIHIEWWYYILPIAIILSVTLIIIGFQTIKAALANPVDSLKTE